MENNGYERVILTKWLIITLLLSDKLIKYVYSFEKENLNKYLFQEFVSLLKKIILKIYRWRIKWN
jgi:hypothetical protein